MAFHLRRLTRAVTSTPISYLVSRKGYIEESRALFPKERPMSDNRLLSLCHLSACSDELLGSKVNSFNTGRKRREGKLEVTAGGSLVKFQKWPNGGGFFHESASIDPTALIEVGAIVHPEAVIGANARVGSGAMIGPAVTIGQATKIGYNVSLSNCSIGDFCVIQNGVCIGQDGFGFFVDEEGKMVKKPQELKAIIGHHVEIGANTCIDRGSWRDTWIGDHTKIDNLVQIGHNVVVGENCMLCGQVGIAGSVTMGDYVTLGGMSGVRDHVSIVSKVRLAANSAVTKNIDEPGDYGGFPAVPIGEWRRQVAMQRRAMK